MDRLISVVQDYAWGDRSFIAQLQNRPPTGEPEAELWMGAHPKAPSRLANSGALLTDHIAADPERSLGPARRSDELPFLKKVLAADQPLSIQTHPTPTRALTGFRREDQAGVPRDAPTRTYRDPNHKPELICALTPFHAKCGFRPVAATNDLLAELRTSKTAALAERVAAPGPETEVLREVLTWLLSLPADEVAELVAGLVAAAADVPKGPWQTEAEWTLRLNQLYPGDVGVAVSLLMHHRILEPGEALFLEAGMLHAYMHGAGIEVMANSDNVIRGGLTPKHIDTVELVEVVDTAPSDPPVQRPSGSVHTYRSPVEEFSLTRIEADGGHAAAVTGPEILIATEGSFRIESNGHGVEVAPGTPVWVDAADAAWTAEGHGTLFRTTVPVRATAPDRPGVPDRPVKGT